jgi:hypothetical protein
LVTQSFFDHAGKIDNPLHLIVFLVLLLGCFIESHCIFLVAHKGDLGHNFELVGRVYDAARLRDPVNVSELFVLEQNALVVHVKDEYRARQEIYDFHLFFLLL